MLTKENITMYMYNEHNTQYYDEYYHDTLDPKAKITKNLQTPQSNQKPI